MRKPKNSEESQGATAANNGLLFEAHIESILIFFGAILVTHDMAELFCRNPLLAPRVFYVKNAKYKRDGSRSGRTEFLLFVRDAKTTNEFSSDCGYTVYRIECKYQKTRGSVEDKICTSLERLFVMPEQKRSILVLSAEGCTHAALMEISDKVIALMKNSERGGNEICVFSARQFEVFLGEVLGKIPVSNKPALNGRTDRDGVTPEHDKIERLKRELDEAQRNVYSATSRGIYDEITCNDSFVKFIDPDKVQQPHQVVNEIKTCQFNLFSEEVVKS